MELEDYSWSTCSKQPRIVDCRIGVVDKLDRRRKRDRIIYICISMGGQLDGNFLPGSLPHKFILIVTSIICFVVNIFFLSLSSHGEIF